MLGKHMTSPGNMQSLLLRVLGHPEFGYRIPADSPFRLERYRAVIDVASLPPFREPLLVVHTGGKPLTYRAGPGDTARLSLPGLVTLVPAGVSSRFDLRGIGEGIAIHFGGPRNVPGWLASSRERAPVTFVDNVIVTLAQQLASAASEPRPDEAYLGVLGNALLAQLRRALARSATGQPLRGSRSALLLVHLATQHVQGHLDEPLGVAELAAISGVGITHFSNTFRRVTGMTPHQYVLKARIGRACEQLRMTSLSIGEVANAVGFAGQSHFCKAFGREMGLTPSRYRRSLRVPETRRRQA
jgi:AraC family transcriptional regulator